jgi:hypothetical protein
VEETEDGTMNVGTIGVVKDGSSWSEILAHVIKGKISLFLMETILSIPNELEYLESLVKLARKKRMKVWKQLIWWNQKKH